MNELRWASWQAGAAGWLGSPLQPCAAAWLNALHYAGRNPICLPMLLPSHKCNCRWVLHGTDVAITALLGEWLCMQKELQEIPMTSLRRERAAAGTTAMAARASGSGGAGSAAAANGSASSSAAVGGGINLARSAANTRSSTANVMELGRVDHSADRQFSKEWAPLSPVDLTKSVQPPPPPR